MTRRGKPTPPYLQPRLAKPTATWPDLDRAAWAKATTCGGPLERGGWASTWTGSSRRKAAVDYGYWLTWLEHQGEFDVNVAPSKR